MLLMLMLMPFFCLSSFFEAFGVHSRRKRNAGNRAKFFGEGSGRGKKGKRRLHKTPGRILMNDEFNKCLTPVKYEA